LGLNEADTLKPSSILIYSVLEQSNYTQRGVLDAITIKGVRLRGWGINEASLKVLIKAVNYR
jgi:hypothetical protein